MDIFQQIQEPISKELKECREMLSDSMSHSNPLLDKALRLIGSRNGKMMRPILTLLTAKLFGEINEKAIHSACAYEAFHTASLVHDDVVDESEQRRGIQSLNYSSGNKVAVLVGDYILSIALKHISMTDIPRLVSIMSEAANRLSDGELLQLHNVNNRTIEEDTYYQIIRNKTAALFSACAQSGAISNNASEEDIIKVGLLGEYIGICFQIRDDIFDYTNDNIGKPTGNDMKEGKLTLPVIYALNKAGNDEMATIAKKVKDLIASQEEITRLVDFTKRNNGIEYSISSMKSYADKAKDIIMEYPDSDVRESLLAYVDYVVGRSF
ncbi:MAG: polyprenyl synthetase family protein [Bacteroidaceae bacterium]|nr:polyprenyl synthetase family protein [Bacteroidaceae bacterium]